MLPFPARNSQAHEGTRLLGLNFAFLATSTCVTGLNSVRVDAVTPPATQCNWGIGQTRSFLNKRGYKLADTTICHPKFLQTSSNGPLCSPPGQ